MKLNLRKIAIITAATLLLPFVSCNRKTQLVYLNNVRPGELEMANPPHYRLRAGDILSIQIVTRDPEIRSLFNIAPSNVANQYISEASILANGFIVSDSGYVNLPVLGKVRIAGQTLREARATLQHETEKYLTDGLVVMKLLSFKVTILGEVNRPGTYTNFKDYLNIFEAIALAGDITDFGERGNLLVLRQTPKGVKTIRLNAHDSNITSSEGFYLLPNDTVIVEPRFGKVMSLNTPTISLFLSVVTTALLLINYIK